MDSNQLRHLEFFSVPNSQTVNPVDQTFDLTGTTGNQLSSMWDMNALAADPGAAGSSSTGPGSLSLESFAQSSPSTAPTSLSMNPAMARQPMLGQPGQVLPTRTARLRDGHERKRSKLSTEANPFDSVDYWIQFDNEESLPNVSDGAATLRPDPRLKGKAPSAQRPINPRQTLGSASAQAPPVVFKPEQYLDDSALDNALSDDDDGFSSINLAEQLSKMDSAPPSDIPPREGLYSTPLSWERPQPGLRMDTILGLNTSTLNEAEQRRLIAIAMNPGPSMGGLGSNLNLNLGGQNSGVNSGLGTGFGASNTLLQPTPSSQSRPAPPTQTRQSSIMEDKGKEKVKPGDRTAHNDIERKYRTNLKDKISELRSAVPSLQTISEAGAEGEESPSQPARTPKVSKGTVLTKATDYIHYLEKRNRQIVQEHQELSRRIQAFEQLLNATARPAFQMPNYSRTLFDPRAFC
ncbi:helix-loop-helix DNA-binding domain-containing protein [Phialemonium atrogriseum]|uniref:Helix-loop-helix DNA-binding domain-containing protein n=1 Tax=Phialemonium atrogriseum TaxID=1093897 RepID=A0AAJ0C058_9PEZI|nr:helix-loop-helix DNA-binding domain-containing protein [Phialemonium atrogriseum]KAK1767720.1 helix-loop-helix DNA-binding domain-containing protein [Phialemonium atrogriseum]